MSYDHPTRMARLNGIAYFLKTGKTADDFRDDAQRIMSRDPKAAKVFNDYADKIDDQGSDTVLKELENYIEYLNRPVVIKRMQSSVQLACDIAGLAGREPKGSDLDISSRFRL